jgi:hypothetical protein
MRQKTDKYQSLKFSIEEKLDLLPYIKRQNALKTLPAALDVSRMTLYSYRSIKRNEKVDIPATKLFILAKFFDCKMEDLFNIHVDIDHFKRISADKKPPRSMGLVR